MVCERQRPPNVPGLSCKSRAKRGFCQLQTIVGQPVGRVEQGVHARLLGNDPVCKTPRPCLEVREDVAVEASRWSGDQHNVPIRQRRGGLRKGSSSRQDRARGNPPRARGTSSRDAPVSLGRRHRMRQPKLGRPRHAASGTVSAERQQSTSLAHADASAPGLSRAGAGPGVNAAARRQRRQSACSNSDRAKS